METSTAPRYRDIWRLTWPVILANSATPLLGLVDTAVIGHTAGSQHLGGVALGSLIFSFVYWGFGFLRMGTTGFVAQATGRRDEARIREVILRGLAMASLIGVGLLLLQWPLRILSLSLFGASNEVETITGDYFRIRIWGAPAVLASYVLLGYFIGRGMSGTLLLVQAGLNGLNMLLDIGFAGYLQWGARGIALGTALAEWITLGLALLLVWRHQSQHTQWPGLDQLPWRGLLAWHKLLPVLRVNLDLMIRTLFLLLGFAVFTDQGARYGDITLAANHILLQFISFCAFFLDGFAYTTEALAGQALGQRDRPRFHQVLRRTTLLAAITALALAAGILFLGPVLLAWLTDLPQVQSRAQEFLIWCGLYVTLSFVAFQLDGLFIGTTTTAPLRNASILATSGFLALVWGLGALGNTGLWLAFVGFVVLRGLLLGLSIDGITRRL